LGAPSRKLCFHHSAGGGSRQGPRKQSFRRNRTAAELRYESEANTLKNFVFFASFVVLWHPSSGLGALSLKLCFQGTGGGSRKDSRKQSFGRERTAAELRYESEWY
jgi:hypothetical protein